MTLKRFKFQENRKSKRTKGALEHKTRFTVTPRSVNFITNRCYRSLICLTHFVYIYIICLFLPMSQVTTNNYDAISRFRCDKVWPSHCAENQEEAMQGTLQQPAGPLSRCRRASCAGFLLPLPLAGSRHPLLLPVPGSPQLGQGLLGLQHFPLGSRKRIDIRIGYTR